jgi:hypothetical protein
LFTDGSTFGGSQVFSEGMNPLGNAARINLAPQGYYLTYVGGDQRAKDNKSILADTGSDPAALNPLANAPWGQRTQAYGFAAIKNSYNLALTREELNGVLYVPGATPVLVGSRAVVDRLSLGGGGPIQSGFEGGMSVRVENWAMGQQSVAYNSFGQAGFGNPEGQMSATGTTERTLTLGVDGGLVFEVAQGVRLGLTGTQLNPKSLWGVNLKPQFRAGLQIDLGPMTKLSVESDINAVEKMPFAVTQQTAAASLRFAVSPAVTFLVGGEQKKIDGQAVTLAGASLQIHTSSLLLVFGFQAGQDNPMKSATVGFL